MLQRSDSHPKNLWPDSEVIIVNQSRIDSIPHRTRSHPTTHAQQRVITKNHIIIFSTHDQITWRPDHSNRKDNRNTNRARSSVAPPVRRSSLSSVTVNGLWTWNWCVPAISTFSNFESDRCKLTELTEYMEELRVEMDDALYRDIIK